jgi:hypothetical protein
MSFVEFVYMIATLPSVGQWPVILEVQAPVKTSLFNLFHQSVVLETFQVGKKLSTFSMVNSMFQTQIFE